MAAKEVVDFGSAPPLGFSPDTLPVLSRASGGYYQPSRSIYPTPTRPSERHYRVEYRQQTPMTLAANSASAWPSPQTAGKLSRDDAVRYLERIKLPASTVEESPSLDLLKKVQRAHMLAVPFESTSIHVKDWRDDRAEIGLGGGEPVALAEGAFRHIVSLKRGGYCFSLNSSFASLLRSFGYNVSECLAKVNSIRKDPAVHGVEWEALSHL